MSHYIFKHGTPHGVYATIQEWRATPSPDLEWEGPFDETKARLEERKINAIYDTARLSGGVDFDGGAWWIDIASNEEITPIALLDSSGIQFRYDTNPPAAVLFLDTFHRFSIWKSGQTWPTENIPSDTQIKTMLAEANITWEGMHEKQIIP